MEPTPVQAGQSGSGLEAPPGCIYVVLPAFNEAENIGPLLEALDDSLRAECLPYEAIVVDDGSGDGTYEIAESCASRLPVRLLRHARNQGLGATIRDGLIAAAQRASAGDVVVTMDADQSHPPGLIPAMVRRLRDGCDVVVASRYQSGSQVHGVSTVRQCLSLGASVLFRLRYPSKGLRDYTCGFRAYRASVLKAAFQRYGDSFVQSSGFECMAEILLRLRMLRPVFAEVPIILRYDLKRGKSKMRLARTSASTFRLLMRRLDR